MLPSDPIAGVPADALRATVRPAAVAPVAAPLAGWIEVVGPAGTLFVSLGALLLAAPLPDRLAQRWRLPQVTILLLIGVVAGPAVLVVLPAAARRGSRSSPTWPSSWWASSSAATSSGPAASIVTGTGAAGGILWEAVREVGGGILLGVVVGVPAATLTGRLQPGRPTLLEALALVFLTAGPGVWLDVSFLLAAIVAGAVVQHGRTPRASVPRDRAHRLAVPRGLLRPGRRVVRSGRPDRVRTARPRLPAAPHQRPRGRRLARDRFPGIADRIVPVVVVSTVIFELVGPAVTRHALRRAGEADA